MFRTNAQTPRLAGQRVTVRHAGPADTAALARLAALDSARAPRGPALLAEADARVVAALPFGSGRPIADPFTRTSHAVALLELRRAQLEAADRSPRRSLVQRVRSLLPRLA
jgi:hypothetical protein